MNEYLRKFNQCRGQERYIPYYKDIMNDRHKTTYDIRSKYTKEYSWAVPDDDALKLIAKFSPIIEMGAGTGYWAYLLDKLDVDIICFDKEPYHNYQANGEWYEVKKGTPLTLRKYPDRNLFLCWAPHSDYMGLQCLRYFRGKFIIYIGESSKGVNCTDDFFRLLKCLFEEFKFEVIPRWHGLHDDITIYKRRK